MSVKSGGGTYLTSTTTSGFTLIELLAVVVILGVLVLVAIPTITNIMNKAKEKTFESQARMLIGAARNASIENPSKICYALSELSNYVNKDISGYSGSVLLDKENKVNKIWLSKEPYIINGSIEEEIEVIELEQYQEASATCEDIEILACSEDPSSYTLVISPDGGIHDGHENNEGYELTKNGTKTITEPTKFGYVFDGWEITGTPTSFIDGLFVMGEENVVIRAKWVTLFTYTGTSSFIDDGNDNWRVKIFTNGTLTLNDNITIDAFLVGGGAGGGGSAGGGGGYTLTIQSIALQKNILYSIVIGAGGASSSAGGNTTAFSYNTGGGQTGSVGKGGSGGSGGGAYGCGGVAGVGGSNGSNGGNSGGCGYTGGAGQGTTTREFGETTGTLYSGGGAGGKYYGGGSTNVGGDGGGGASGVAGVTNSGGGGGGPINVDNATSGGAGGGSGIVIIRNHR